MKYSIGENVTYYSVKSGHIDGTISDINKHPDGSCTYNISVTDQYKIMYVTEDNIVKSNKDEDNN